jgi:hypothetical protein
MSSRIAFAGLSAARSRVARLAAGLSQIAGGAVLQRAAAKIGEQIVAVAEQRAAAHQETGTARGSVQLTMSGPLVQLSNIGYLHFHSWWPFRRGMPPFVLKRASVILSREVLGLLSEQNALGGDLGAEASEVVDEADAAIAKRAARKAETKRRREDRAYDRRVKASEDREGR